MSEKQPAHNFKSIKCPDCSKDCALAETMGVWGKKPAGECESVCWWKFNSKTGLPLETFTTPTDTDIIVHTMTKPKDSK